MALTGDSVR